MGKGVRLPESDILLLEEQNEDVLTDWWCQLNLWKWPEGISNEENPVFYLSGGRRNLLMHKIVELVGTRSCLAKWRKLLDKGELYTRWK